MHIHKRHIYKTHIHKSQVYASPYNTIIHTCEEKPPPPPSPTCGKTTAIRPHPSETPLSSQNYRIEGFKRGVLNWAPIMGQPLPPLLPSNGRPPVKPKRRKISQSPPLIHYQYPGPVTQYPPQISNPIFPFPISLTGRNLHPSA